MRTCKELFGSWYTVDQFQKAVDHLILSWSESRHNPNFSRFDAVNNKYEQHIELINIRSILPPLVQRRLVEENWFYSPNPVINPLAMEID
jgi:hypothetical protein